MNRKYNIQLNLSPYANVYEDGGGMVYNPNATGFVRGNFSTDWTPQGISPNDAVLSDYQQKMVNKADMKQAIAEKGDGFLNTMNSSGGGGWAAAIAPAATNMINAITDTEASTAERVATAMGIPALAKIWTADNTAGDANLKAMQSNIDTFAKQNLIQDASSTFGANNAVKLNNKFIAPVPMTGVKDLSWKDFRGNMFKKGAAATLQGAAAGSVGGPWGALGGAVTGLFGSLFGGIGARSRAKKAYAEYQNKMATLTSQANSMYKQALTNQTLSNMQALANGNMSQMINDMANIRAYGGGIDPYYPESQDPTAVNWLSDWYRQRPEQMQNTFKPTRYNDYSFTLPKPNISGEYESIEDIPSNRSVGWETRKYNDINEYNNALYHNLIDRAASPSILYRMDLPSDTKGVYSATGLYEKEKNLPPEDIDKSTKIIEFIDNFKVTHNNQSPKLEDYEAAGLNPLDLEGMFTTQIETGKLPKVANTISYNMREVPAYANPEEDYYDAETLSNRIHETNHAIQNDNRGISRSLSNIVNMNKQTAAGVVPNSYLDSPEEIHSRMMQLRYETGLKPTDVITQDFIDNNKDKIKALNLNRYTDQSLINLLNNVVDNNNVNSYNNIAAMGGNLYTDLSPNMMSLWNNKQQIDQQKSMNQQFSLGLGNSSFVNKFEIGGPVDPPKEFMDRYHPDWGEYTPEYANMTFDEYKQKYGNPNDPDNFNYSPESYNSYQYRLYQPYPNSSTFGNSYLFRPEIEVLNKKYPIENLPVYRDENGDLYLKRGIKDLYGNNSVYIDGDTEDPTYNRRNKNGDLRITPHKDEWELGHSNSDKSIPRERFEDFKKSSEDQVLNELRRRAYDNEFYSYGEVQRYKTNNSKQTPSNTTTKKTANTTATKSSSERKAPSKTTTKSANNIDNMTYQQMENYYGQKQSPLLNAQYKNTWAEGGQMTSADVPENMQYYANGGTHEENPYGGIQVGVDQQGTPNLAEEGEFRWNNFVFSDRINVDANLLSSFNLMPTTKHQNKKASKGKLSYADMAKKYAKRNKELENDPITKNSMEAFMQRLANAQEYQKKAEQLEAQKQNELQDYKTALNKQNNNPMYGTMKYNGMGNAATQQGVNSGVDAGMGNPMSNADLSNVNRSGNEMMAAYGGNLFARGGNDPNPFEWTLDNLNARQVLTPWNSNFIGPTLGDNTNLGYTPNADNYSWSNIAANTPFYQNEGWGIDMKPTYMKVKNPNYNAPAVSTYASRDKNGNIIYDPSGKPFMSYPRTYEGMKSPDYPNTKVIGKTVDSNGFYLNAPQYTPPAQGKVIQPEYEPDLSDYKAAYYKDFDSNGINTTPYVQDGIARGNNGISNIPITASGINPTGVPSDSSNNIGDTNTVVTNPNNINTDSRIGKTTTNTNPDAAIPSDPSEPPLYSTAGKYAQFGKGIMPMIWDWANKTNVAYDPYQKDADRLEALANEGPALRTADTIGGYRAPNLMDVERLNNSARAEGIAQMQAILDAANGNRGYVGAHSAQNNYNTQMGIGDNYVKTQEANNTNRLQTDQFNHGINVANQNAINAMYQDNQRAEQTQHQEALSGTAQAAALRQRENLHADEVNTERMKNRATNQAAAVDNALNYFTTQAMENQELNTRNNDPTNPYWIDKYGRTHYTGDSGLTQAIRDAFGNDEYGRNGTFTGDRLTEWNDLIKNKKYNAKYLKEHPELWQHLVTQQREANKIDAEKAEQARTEELEALRGTYQSNLARLNALRDSGAIISDPSYNLYTGWADDDYSGNQGLLRTRNQALDQYITQIGNNYDRYLYEKQLAQNQAKALGGYLNAGQNNNNDYYSYTRI